MAVTSHTPTTIRRTQSRRLCFVLGLSCWMEAEMDHFIRARAISWKTKLVYSALGMTISPHADKNIDARHAHQKKIFDGIVAQIAHCVPKTL
jgi:hypothetical protein